MNEINTSCIDVEIDKLTHSIENVITGESFPTEVIPLAKTDLPQITKKTVGSLIGN